MDGLRGLAVVLMVLHHFFYDLVVFLGAPMWLFSNPVFDVLHYVFAGLFIILSGVSSRFSRSNLKRGIKVLIVAFVIQLVTTFLDMPIRFGVLHLLGFCMVLYGITQKVWDNIPNSLMPVICIVLAIISALCVNLIDVGVSYLWVFGWTDASFFSADYFPIFPWMFLFLLGTWLGKHIKDEKLPRWFYESKMPFFAPVGRKALLIYIVHQPVLYGITMLLSMVTG